MEELDELINRYVSGDMDEVERAGFNERLRHDKTLADRVALYRSVSENLSARFKTAQKKNQLKDTLTKIDQEYFGQEKSTPGSAWYKWAAAACVALLCGAFFYNNFSSSPQYDEFAIYEPMAIVERGETDVMKIKAQATFNAGKYTEAIPYFDSLLTQDPENMEVLLYKGIALLEENRTEQAEIIFNAVRDSNSVHSDEATWMLALSALKQKDYDRCKEILLQIDSGSSVYRKASELLKKL
jgi:predicted Zn-dependent protease